MEIKQAPAIGYSIVSNLGGDRQMTVQCFVGEDEVDAEVNSKIDRVFRVVDRQRARYQLVDLREERIKTSETLAQFEEDYARVEADYKKAAAERGVQLLELEQRRQGIHDGAYSTHAKSGRQTAFEPRGHTKQALDAFDAAKAQVEAEQVKADGERDQHKSNLDISLTRFRKALVAIDEKIAAAEALLEPEKG